MRLTGHVFRKQHNPAALPSVAVVTKSSKDLAVGCRRHTSRLEVTQQCLGRRLNVVDLLKVLSNLPHQIVLVGRSELRAAFLVATIELVHLETPSIPSRWHPDGGAHRANYSQLHLLRHCPHGCEVG